MLVNLNYVLEYGEENNCAVAGFNVFGFEDACAVIKAAESQNSPVILMANKVAVAHMPVKVLGAMLVEMAKAAEVPVVVHLDHSPSVETVRAGIEAGFTSVMLDASQHSFEENSAWTREVVKLARPKGISVESEIGSVGYSGNSDAKTMYTDPDEAKRFFEETGVDALAISIGNLHRMTTQTVHLQFDLLDKIHSLIPAPLVLHGSSGVPDDELKEAIRRGIRKVNIGTALRMVFGNTLRDEITNKPDVFDRLELFKECMIRVQQKAEEKIALMKA